MGQKSPDERYARSFAVVTPTFGDRAFLASKCAGHTTTIIEGETLEVFVFACDAHVHFIGRPG
jgi:hypothetical protein